MLLYAYATGVFRRRAKLEEDVAFRVLGAGNFPQHPVPAAALVGLQGAVCSGGSGAGIEAVETARRCGRTRANGRRFPKEGRRLRGEIEALLAAAGAADAAEDARLGAAVRGDELPAELRRREDRLVRAAKSRLEAQQRAADDARGRQPDQDRNPKGGQPYKRSYGEPDAKAQSNFTGFSLRGLAKVQGAWCAWR